MGENFIISKWRGVRFVVNTTAWHSTENVLFQQSSLLNILALLEQIFLMALYYQSAYFCISSICSDIVNLVEQKKIDQSTELMMDFCKIIPQTWKDIMKAASSNTSVLVVINIEKMLERLGKCKTLLNMIQNGLGGYLETKRLFFPRFFFLSNKEILSIISNTRDPSGYVKLISQISVRAIQIVNVTTHRCKCPGKGLSLKDFLDIFLVCI